MLSCQRSDHDTRRYVVHVGPVPADAQRVRWLSIFAIRSGQRLSCVGSRGRVRIWAGLPCVFMFYVQMGHIGTRACMGRGGYYHGLDCSPFFRSRHAQRPQSPHHRHTFRLRFRLGVAGPRTCPHLPTSHRSVSSPPAVAHFLMVAPARPHCTAPQPAAQPRRRPWLLIRPQRSLLILR